MKKTPLFILLLVFVACSANKRLAGKYFKQGIDFKETLILKQDSTFLLREQAFEVDSKCEGRWHRLTNNTLLLKCDAEKNMFGMLQSGYMSNRSRTAKILKRGQIAIGKVVLAKE